MVSIEFSCKQLHFFLELERPTSLVETDENVFQSPVAYSINFNGISRFLRDTEKSNKLALAASPKLPVSGYGCEIARFVLSFRTISLGIARLNFVAQSKG